MNSSLAISLFILLLNGCTSILVPLDPDAYPDLKTGYIFGAFTSKGSAQISTTLLFTDVNRFHIDSEGTRVPKQFSIMMSSLTPFAVFSMKPGEYSLSKFQLINNMGTVQKIKNDYKSAELIFNKLLNQKFTVLAGEIYYIGDYHSIIIVNRKTKTAVGELSSIKNNYANALLNLENEFPDFIDLPLKIIPSIVNLSQRKGGGSLGYFADNGSQ